MRIHTIIIYVVAFCFGFMSYSQNNLSVAEVRYDIDYLIEKATDIHPNLYEHITSRKLKDTLYSILNNRDSISSKEYNMHLKNCIKLIKDDHTFISSVSKNSSGKGAGKYSFQLYNDSTAVLILTSFSFSQKETVKYKKFIDSTFSYLNNNKIKKLLIDVSVNSGGNSYHGDYVMDYLTSQPYQPYAQLALKRSETSKKYFRKKFLKWYLYPIAVFSKQARQVMFKSNGIEELDLEPIVPQQREKYGGDVIVAISGNTFSAAATFASSFINSKRGLTVGTATGQPCKGYIDIVYFTLPNSGIETGVSFKSYTYSPCAETNSGIAPDIILERDKKESLSEYYKEIFKLAEEYVRL